MSCSPATYDRVSRLPLNHSLRERLIDFSVVFRHHFDKPFDELLRGIVARKENDLLKAVLEDKSIAIGHDAVLAVVDACFYENPIGLDLLLGSERVVLRGEAKNKIQHSICFNGSLELVKKVLSDPRFAIDEKTHIPEVLGQVSSRFRDDSSVFSMILKSEHCAKYLNDEIVINRILQSDNPNAMRLLLDDPRFDAKRLGYELLRETLYRYGCIDMITTIMSHERTDLYSNDNSKLFRQIVSSQRTYIIEELLKDERLKLTMEDMYYVMNAVVLSGRLALLDIILGDKRLDVSKMKHLHHIIFMNAVRGNFYQAIGRLLRFGVYGLQTEECRNEVRKLGRCDPSNLDLRYCFMALLESRMMFHELIRAHVDDRSLTGSACICLSNKSMEQWIKDKYLPVLPIVLKVVSKRTLQGFRDSQHTKDVICKDKESNKEQKEDAAGFRIDREAVAYLSVVAETLAEEGDVIFDVSANVVADYIVGFPYD